MPRLVFSPRAENDLEEIGDYIAADNPGRAVSFLAELRERCRLILDMPMSFPVCEDFGPGVRMAVHRRYLILFRIGPRDIRIERVLHAARRPPRRV